MNRELENNICNNKLLLKEHKNKLEKLNSKLEQIKNLVLYVPNSNIANKKELKNLEKQIKTQIKLKEKTSKTVQIEKNCWTYFDQKITNDSKSTTFSNFDEITILHKKMNFHQKQWNHYQNQLSDINSEIQRLQCQRELIEKNKKVNCPDALIILSQLCINEINSLQTTISKLEQNLKVVQNFDDSQEIPLCVAENSLKNTGATQFTNASLLTQTLNTNHHENPFSTCVIS